MFQTCTTQFHDIVPDFIDEDSEPWSHGHTASGAKVLFCLCEEAGTRHCPLRKQEQADVRDSSRKAHFKAIAKITPHSANVPNTECTSVSQPAAILMFVIKTFNYPGEVNL